MSASSFLGACDRNEPTDPGPPYRARVLVLNQAAGASDVPTYSLESRSFSYLSNVRNLDGKYFKVIFGGELAIKDIIGSQVSNPRFKGGSRALLRYDIKGGEIVARDYTTLALLSAYYQYEQFFSVLEGLTGVSPDQFLADNGKMEILFEPSITIKDGGLDAQFIQKLNAAYIPGEKQFVLFRRSAIERVPLGLNYQVIAHEFGHALYELGFYQNRFDRCEVAQQHYVLRGLNEGFADVVSWAATGSADVLRSSFPFDEIANPRNFAEPKFDYPAVKNPDLLADENQRCKGGIYCIGTLFAASVLKAHQQLGLANDETSRASTMRMVFDSLKKTRETMNAAATPVAQRARAFLEGSDCDYDLGDSIDDQDDDVTASYLAAFVAGAPAQWKAPLCSAFGSFFGDQGFDVSVRTGVCP